MHALHESLAVLACLKVMADVAGTRACILLVFTDDPSKHCPLNWSSSEKHGCCNHLGGQEETGRACHGE